MNDQDLVCLTSVLLTGPALAAWPALCTMICSEARRALFAAAMVRWFGVASQVFKMEAVPSLSRRARLSQLIALLCCPSFTGVVVCFPSIPENTISASAYLSI